jgi:hypothetical protein
MAVWVPRIVAGRVTTGRYPELLSKLRGDQKCAAHASKRFSYRALMLGVHEW